MFNEIIHLVSYEDSGNVDDYGDKILNPIYERRFAKLKSVSQSEFYQAQTVGIKPEIKMELADYFDYAGQEEVVYDGVLYKVLRTYRTTSNSMELTLYGGVRDVNTKVSDEIE